MVAFLPHAHLTLRLARFRFCIKNKANAAIASIVWRYALGTPTLDALGSAHAIRVFSEILVASAIVGANASPVAATTVADWIATVPLWLLQFVTLLAAANVFLPAISV